MAGTGQLGRRDRFFGLTHLAYFENSLIFPQAQSLILQLFLKGFFLPPSPSQVFPLYLLSKFFIFPYQAQSLILHLFKVWSFSQRSFPFSSSIHSFPSLVSLKWGRTNTSGLLRNWNCLTTFLSALLFLVSHPSSPPPPPLHFRWLLLSPPLSLSHNKKYRKRNKSAGGKWSARDTGWRAAQVQVCNAWDGLPGWEVKLLFIYFFSLFFLFFFFYLNLELRL